MKDYSIEEIEKTLALLDGEAQKEFNKITEFMCHSPEIILFLVEKVKAYENLLTAGLNIEQKKGEK